MDLLIKFIAVLIAMLLGHPLLFWVTERLRDIRNKDKEENEKPEIKKDGSGKITFILGLLERGLTATIWFWGRYEFIGFWFAGKVIGNWDRRKDSDQGAFGGYLIATTISILFAVSVAIFAEWLTEIIKIN